MRAQVVVLRILVALVVVVLVVGYLGICFLTYFTSCGFAGCEARSTRYPVEAQRGLLLGGLTLVPLTLILLRPKRLVGLTLAACGAFAVGASFVMLLAQVGPNGCPWGETRAENVIYLGKPEVPDRLRLTCSGDPNAF